MTGTLNRIGSHLALAFKHEPLPDVQGPWDTHGHRAFLLAGIWAGFLIGAMLAGAATLHFGGWVLLPPFLILLGLAAFSRGQGDDSAFGQSGGDREGTSGVQANGRG